MENIYLQMPQVPPSFLQYLQYLQFLHAWQTLDPVQVANRRLRVDLISFDGAALNEASATRRISKDLIIWFFDEAR